MAIYWRVTYNDIGVYQELKSQIWDDKSSFSKEDWENFKKCDDVDWLKVPNVYSSDNYSYFTEKGFALFKKRTYPLIVKWLDKEKIKFDKCCLCFEKINLIYNDEHQVVIEKGSE